MITLTPGSAILPSEDRRARMPGVRRPPTRHSTYTSRTLHVLEKRLGTQQLQSSCSRKVIITYFVHCFRPPAHFRKVLLPGCHVQ
jgi:hypothetical protein